MRQSPISASISAAVMKLLRSLNSEVKISPIGMRAHRVLDLSLERLDLRGKRLERGDQAEARFCRRAISGPHPTRPSGARLSLANGRAAAAGRRCNAGGPGTPAGAARPATHASPRGWGSAPGTRARSGCPESVGTPIGPGRNPLKLGAGVVVRRHRPAYQILARGVDALSALVSSVSGSSTRKRW